MPPCCRLPSRTWLQTETSLPLASIPLPPMTAPSNLGALTLKLLLELSSLTPMGPPGQSALAHPFPVLQQLRPALEVESFSPQDGRLLPSRKAQSKGKGEAGFQSLEPRGRDSNAAEPGFSSLESFQPCRERDVSYSAPSKTFTRGVWAPPAGRTLTTLARNHLIPNPVPINQTIGIQC